MIYSPAIVTRLNAVAHKNKDLIYKSVHEVLVKIENTGKGAQSLQVDVVDGDENKSPQIHISFDDHLIFINKRKLQWTKLPEIKKLMEWAVTKTSNETQAKKLAWAVAWDKRKHDTWKPKYWRKKSLSGVLKAMNEMIVKAYDEALEEDLQKATK